MSQKMRWRLCRPSLISSWTILNPELPTKTLSTVGFSGMGLASFLSLVRPSVYSTTAGPAELMLILSVAVVAICFFLLGLKKGEQ